jgi:hypothetical protein
MHQPGSCGIARRKRSPRRRFPAAAIIKADMLVALSWFRIPRLTLPMKKQSLTIPVSPKPKTLSSPLARCPSPICTAKRGVLNVDTGAPYQSRCSSQCPLPPGRYVHSPLALQNKNHSNLSATNLKPLQIFHCRALHALQAVRTPD